MFCIRFGFNWSIGLENDNEIFTIYTDNNEGENYRQRLSFKQKSSLASSDELKVNTKMKTLFKFKILFIDFIDHAYI